MQTNITDYSGSYIAIAGIFVTILGRFGVVIATNDAVSIIAALVMIYGIIKQMIAHDKLAASVTGSATPTK